LVLVARRQAELETIAERLRQTHAIEVVIVSADLSTRQGVAQALEATASMDIGLFVAAAGFGTSGPFIENELETELGMIDVNCKAVVEMTHVIARRFSARQRGGIMLFSSLVAFQGAPMAANYAATKAFVQSFAEGIREELKGKHVDVLSCAPGPVHTGFADRAGMKMGFAAYPEDIALEMLEAMGCKTTCRPGWQAKFLIGSLSMLPRFARVKIIGQIMGSMARQ
jgi:short-subunit dehydrogenase